MSTSSTQQEKRHPSPSQELIAKFNSIGIKVLEQWKDFELPLNQKFQNACTSLSEMSPTTQNNVIEQVRKMSPKLANRIEDTLIIHAEEKNIVRPSLCDSPIQRKKSQKREASTTKTMPGLINWGKAQTSAAPPAPSAPPAHFTRVVPGKDGLRLMNWKKADSPSTRQHQEELQDSMSLLSLKPNGEQVPVTVTVRPKNAALGSTRYASPIVEGVLEREDSPPCNIALKQVESDGLDVKASADFRSGVGNAPHILPSYGTLVSTDGDDHYRATELNTPFSIPFLTRLTKEERVEKVKIWAKSLFEFTFHIHEKGFVHRDIKPENLVFGPNKELYVMDFETQARLTALTAPSGELIAGYIGKRNGTYEYQAPEESSASNEKIRDHRVDYWSIGSTLNYLLTMQDTHKTSNRLRGEYLGYDAWRTQLNNGICNPILPGTVSNELPEEAYLNAAPEQKLLFLCNQLMQNNPDHRPTKPDILRFLDTLK
ncbi:hypothetical protein HOH87_06945 [bacterium]|nr:hypothetical protein [bacterium]